MHSPGAKISSTSSDADNYGFSFAIFAKTAVQNWNWLAVCEMWLATALNQTFILNTFIP